MTKDEKIQNEIKIAAHINCRIVDMCAQSATCGNFCALYRNIGRLHAAGYRKKLNTVIDVVEDVKVRAQGWYENESAGYESICDIVDNIAREALIEKQDLEYNKLIDEMAVIAGECPTPDCARCMGYYSDFCSVYACAKNLYRIGYRKEKEVVGETLVKIISRIRETNPIGIDGFATVCAILLSVADDFGVKDYQ